MTRGSTTQTRTFVYNDTGTLASATNPENGTVNYTYNADNTLATKIDARGLETDYYYDSAKRLVLKQEYPLGKTYPYDLTCNFVSYAYDGTLPSGSTFVPYYATGRLTTISYAENASCNAPGTSPAAYIGQGYVETYAYHPAGGVIDKEFVIYPSTAWSPLKLDVTYSYTTAGQVASVSYPNDGRPDELVRGLLESEHVQLRLRHDGAAECAPG